MADLETRLAQARSLVRAEWSGLRQAAIEQGAERIRARRRVARVGLAGVALVGVAAVWPRVDDDRRPHAGSAGLRATPTVSTPNAEPVSSPAPAPAGPTERVLADGSRLIPLRSGSRVRELPRRPGEVTFEVVEGRVRFEIRPNPARTFLVRAGIVTIRVVGTKFTVERGTAGVGIWVDEGRVAAGAGDRWEPLVAGQTRWFPPIHVPAVASFAARSENGSSQRGAGRPVASFESRSAASPAATASLVAARDEVADLLLAADFARAGENAAEALEPLRRIVDGHAGDARAPLAAFTLGRLLLDLGRPADAAAAFARTRDFDSNGPLSEDALAREVEAWALAGDAERARARAHHYLKLHPDGRRALMVRRRGGLP